MAAEQVRAEEAARLKAEAKAKAKEEARGRAIQRFWDSLSEDERQKQEEQAIAQATDLERDMVRKGGSLAGAVRKNLLDAFALLTMSQG